MADQAERAAVKCAVAVGGAAVLGYAGKELLQYANGQAIIAGAALPALTVFLLALLVGAALHQLAK